MRVDVRDGHERDGGDGVSLRSVASVVLKRKNSAATEGERTAATTTAGGSRWFGLSRNASVRSRTRTPVATDAEEEDEAHEEEDRGPPTPPKVSPPSRFRLWRANQ